MAPKTDPETDALRAELDNIIKKCAVSTIMLYLQILHKLLK